MINSLIAQGRLPDTCHIHYAPHEFDVVLGKELKAMDRYNDRYHLHLMYSREGDDPSRNRFSAAQLDALCPDWKERDVYACGPLPCWKPLSNAWKTPAVAASSMWSASVHPLPIFPTMPWVAECALPRAM